MPPGLPAAARETLAACLCGRCEHGKLSRVELGQCRRGRGASGEGAERGGFARGSCERARRQVSQTTTDHTYAARCDAAQCTSAQLCARGLGAGRGCARGMGVRDVGGLARTCNARCRAGRDDASRQALTRLLVPQAPEDVGSLVVARSASNRPSPGVLAEGEAPASGAVLLVSAVPPGQGAARVRRAGRGKGGGLRGRARARRVRHGRANLRGRAHGWLR